MKLCIADPPYLGRGQRWYGGGRGSSPRWPAADNHPEARKWDEPEAHIELVERLVSGYDGWAIAASADSLPLYLRHVPVDSRVLVWHKRNALPSGWRVMNTWEPVIAYLPTARRARVNGQVAMRDLLDAPNRPSGFVGSKPKEWTAWVLQALGYEKGDVVDDLFPGSGAVSEAIRALSQELPIAGITA